MFNERCERELCMRALSTRAKNRSYERQLRTRAIRTIVTRATNGNYERQLRTNSANERTELRLRTDVTSRLQAASLQLANVTSQCYEPVIIADVKNASFRADVTSGTVTLSQCYEMTFRAYVTSAPLRADVMSVLSCQ